MADLQRAIALIQRLKALHRDDKWNASLEHYQTLRVMLADIAARHPEPTLQLRMTLREAVAQIVAIESDVDQALGAGTVPALSTDLNDVLNTIQVNLEEMASSTYFLGSEAR